MEDSGERATTRIIKKEIEEILNGEEKRIDSSLAFNSSIYFAVSINDIQLCRKILDHDPKTDLNPSALLLASFRGLEEMVRNLLDFGSDPNFLSQDSSPLLYACTNGHIGVVRILLEFGADPNLFTEKGVSPLFVSVKNRDYEMTRILLQGGADPNLQPWKYINHIEVLSVLSLAIVERRDIEFIRMLLEYGADPLLEDKKKWSAYSYCFESKATPIEVMKLLEKYGGTWNGKRNFYFSSLKNGWEGGKEVVQHVLTRGCDPNWKDLEGVTAMLAGCNDGDLEVVETVLKFGGNPDQTDNDNMTPIQTAIESDSEFNEDMVRILIRYNANLNMESKDGTPHQLCILYTKPTILKILIECGATIPPQHIKLAEYIHQIRNTEQTGEVVRILKMKEIKDE